MPGPWPSIDHPAIIAAGPHLSLLDGPWLCAKLPRPAVFAVDPDYARHPVWRPVLRTWGRLCGGHTMIPMRPGRASGVRTLLSHLRGGGWVVIFPSGCISESAPDHPGVDWLAARSGAPVHRVRLRHGLRMSDKIRLISGVSAEA
jgi:1-acyl-sn-glycerol-3-phosphate acyltransferase